MKKCAYCKNEFEPKKPKAIYCCDRCRTYAYRTKKQVDFEPTTQKRVENTTIPPKTMPKGLSIIEQLEWREKNGDK